MTTQPTTQPLLPPRVALPSVRPTRNPVPRDVADTVPPPARTSMRRFIPTCAGWRGERAGYRYAGGAYRAVVLAESYGGASCCAAAPMQHTPGPWGGSYGPMECEVAS